MTNYDTIIVGSGVGGLAAGICLARAGQKVLILEQHYVPGGWCHSFQLNGQRFSPGVHYIGLIDEGDSTNELYKSLGIANELIFFRMNPKGYEHCIIGNYKIDMAANMDALYDSLSAQFPHEKKGLKKYLTLVEKVSNQIQLIPKMKGFWSHVTIPFRTKEMGKYSLFSLKRVIDWHIKDPLLKAVLNVQCGDHGLPPFKASFPVHCVLMYHYFNGGFYPMGGGGAIVKAMTNVIKKHGGEIRVSQCVSKILVENNTAIGVQLSNGEKILGTNILSNADPNTTFLKLVGKENISKKLATKLSKTKYSVASLILFLTLDMDVSACGLDSGNIWYLRHENIDELYHELTAKDISQGHDFPAVFMSCTTLKDPASFNGRYHNFEIVTFIDYDSFDAFNHSKDYHGEAYTSFKEKIVEKLMNNVERIIPNAKNHVIQAELGTPKTNQYYINSTNGSVYGTEKSFTQIGPFSFKFKTEIENLFLCGASTTSHGIGGATHSGVEAAAAILNCSKEELLQPDPNQKLRIYDAEDSSTWSEFIHAKRADKIRRFEDLNKPNSIKEKKI